MEEKKRGRKKKVIDEELKQPKKRGRKAVLKYFSSSVRDKMQNLPMDECPNILHINIEIEETCQDSGSLYDKVYSTDTNILEEYIASVADKEENPNALRSLYETRIHARKTQDEKLSDTLEILRDDSEELDKFLTSLTLGPISEPTDARTDVTPKEYFMSSLDGHWPNSTNIACWNCCHTFNTTPIGIPVGYRHGEFRVNGIFCSFGCIVRYITDNNTLYKYKANIQYMYRYLTGDYLTFIPSPPRELLEMFGGVMTITDYRSAAEEKKIFKFVRYPLFISRDYVKEIDIKNIKEANDYIFKAPVTKSKMIDISKFLKTEKVLDKKLNA